jgi:hypothetical protein
VGDFESWLFDDARERGFFLRNPARAPTTAQREDPGAFRQPQSRLISHDISTRIRVDGWDAGYVGDFESWLFDDARERGFFLRRGGLVGLPHVSRIPPIDPPGANTTPSKAEIAQWTLGQLVNDRGGF